MYVCPGMMHDASTTVEDDQQISGVDLIGSHKVQDRGRLALRWTGRLPASCLAMRYHGERRDERTPVLAVSNVRQTE